MCKGISHLKCKDTDHRFMITDAVLHVACVQVLSDLQRVLLILLYLLDPPNIRNHPFFPLAVLKGVFGSQPPQNPVSPGRFPFLRADTVVKGDVVIGETESRDAFVSQVLQKSACLCKLTSKRYNTSQIIRSILYISCWLITRLMTDSIRCRGVQRRNQY